MNITHRGARVSRLRGTVLIMLSCISAALAVDGIAVSVHRPTRQGNGEPHLWGDLVRHDISGSSVTRSTVIFSGQARLPSINQTGSLVAFLRRPGTISVTGIRGGEVRDLSRGLSSVMSIDWPDGRWVYFAEGECGSTEGVRLSRIHVDSGIPEQLLVLGRNGDTMFRSWPWTRNVGSQGVVTGVSPMTVERGLRGIPAGIRIPLCPLQHAVSHDGMYGVSMARKGTEVHVWNSATHNNVARLDCTDLDACDKSGPCCAVSRVRWASNSSDWLSAVQTWNGRNEDGANLVLHNWATHEVVPVTRHERGSSGFEVGGDFWLHQGPGISVMPSELEFIIPRFSSTTVYAKTVAVGNSGAGLLPRLEPSVSGDADWVSAHLSGSSNNRVLSVRVDRTKLDVGVHTVDIALRGRGVSTGRVRVKVRVVAADLSGVPQITRVDLEAVNRIALTFSCRPDPRCLPSLRCAISHGIEVKRVLWGADENTLALISSTDLGSDSTYRVEVSGFRCGSMHPESTSTVAADFGIERGDEDLMKGVLARYAFINARSTVVTNTAGSERAGDLHVRPPDAVPVRRGVLSCGSSEVSTGFVARFGEEWARAREFSAEMWVRALPSKAGAGGPVLVMADMEGRALFGVEQRGADVIVSAATGASLRLPGVVGREPLYLVVSVDSMGRCAAFVNGSLANTQAGAPYDRSSVNRPLKLYLGSAPGAGPYWHGEFFSLVLHRRALDLREVRAGSSRLPESVRALGRSSGMATLSVPRKDITTDQRIGVRYDLNGDLLVTVPANQAHTAELVGMDGKAITTYQGSSPREYTFARAPLASGIYMIRVTIGRKIVSRMVIVP